MSKKYLGKNPLNTLIGIVLDVIPSKEIGDTDVNEMWGNIINPPKVIEVAPDGALSNWSYTLDDDNNIVTLKQYIGSETNVIVYGRYKIGDKVYDTKIRSSTSDANYMFYSKTNIKTITFNEGIDTSSVTNMYGMFCKCKALTTINGLEYFDTSKVIVMGNMFSDCNSLTSLDISSFNTSNVTSMRYMFYDCRALTEIKVTTGKWTIPSGCNTTNMFASCGVSAVTYYPAA